LAFATFLVWRLRTGACGLALAALALVVFGAIECPLLERTETKQTLSKWGSM